MNSLYGRLIQKIYERSYAQCSAAGGKKLYAAHRDSSGGGASAGHRQLLHQCDDHRNLWTGGFPGRRNPASQPAHHHEQGG